MSSAAIPLGGTRLPTELAALFTHIRQLHAQALDLIADMDTHGLAGEAGYSSLPAFLADLLRVSPRRASGLVAQAAQVAETVTPTGHVQPATLPTTRAALHAGELDGEHLTVITEVVKKIPARAPAGTHEIVDTALADTARTAHPGVVRRHGDVLLARIDQDGTHPNEPDEAEPGNSFRYRRTLAGRMVFTGDIEPEAAEELETMLGALATPQSPVPGMPDQRTVPQRLGDAFTDIMHLAVTSPDLPARGGEKPHLNLTLDYHALHDNTGAATLEGGPVLSPAAARRIACDAKLVPMVLSTNSVPLDQGRTHRVVTTEQRRALITRDHGCTFPGCHLAARWCDAHHVKTWLDGGPTNLNNLLLICRRHHRILHHTEWQARIINGLPEFLPPRWLDPHQQPRQNILHHPRE